MRLHNKEIGSEEEQTSNMLNVRVIIRGDGIIGFHARATLKLVYMHRLSMEWLSFDYFTRIQLHLGPQPIKAKASHLSVTFFIGTFKIPVDRTLTTPIVISFLLRFQKVSRKV